MITVLGSTGFIGSVLVDYLSRSNKEYYAPARNEDLRGKKLDAIIYCIGLTADFRQRPLDTVEAHVCKLMEVIRECEFHKIVYLSSTRVYGAIDTTKENVFQVSPQNPSDLYNISKLMGEALIHTLGDKGCVVRLSNVYGKDYGSSNFLSDIFQDAIESQVIELETTLDSEKDYINVDDVAKLLIEITLFGKKRIYNVASGVNTSNKEILEKLQELTDCEVKVKPDAKRIIFPPIPIDEIISEFEYKPSNLVSDIPNLLAYYRENLEIRK